MCYVLCVMCYVLCANATMAQKRGNLRFYFAKTSVLGKCTGCFDKFLKNVVLKFLKKQLTEEEERGKLIWLSQRNDSFEETI